MRTFKLSRQQHDIQHLGILLTAFILGIVLLGLQMIIWMGFPLDVSKTTYGFDVSLMVLAAFPLAMFGLAGIGFSYYFRGQSSKKMIYTIPLSVPAAMLFLSSFGYLSAWGSPMYPIVMLLGPIGYVLYVIYLRQANQ